MLKLENTPACKMRDELIKARYAKQITLNEITDKLIKIDLPLWLQGDIIAMVNHNKYKRITCAVELAMEAAVSVHILNEIMSDSNL